ncbi:6-phospho-beta-glucosidase [Vagococcus salmoninarum]|uniref:6-phospho-beta-glucosidase n=1 Tax=Vagococcus salmoninarum TaxID=2739 RepID=UPI00187DE663|nr:6-phospho-beta-glucosidase [Vagococcus salmoninarum]MBE9388206.1 6-phospho-beta-glucosidase [Vagococcus salmoninarum]
MNKTIKIVTIGGGSSYTPELIEGFIKRQKTMPISEIWLVDIPEGQHKLEIVAAMAERMIKAAGLDWKLIATTNRQEALKDADFVTTQFRVGQLDARIKDECLPLAHDILGQETNGAGGILKAFRTIPVILEIIEDMKMLCPNAWLINFTNPAGMITEAAINHGRWKRTLGLCNLPLLHASEDAEYLKLEEKDLYIKFAGINHFHWHRVWDREGQERTADLLQLLYGTEDEQAEGVKNIHNEEFNYSHLKDLGLLPCYYHRYYYVSDDMLQASITDYKQKGVRAQVVKETEKRLFELYKDPTLNYKPKELSERGGAFYSDAACEAINAIYNDSRITMVVSTTNNGAISNLPNDSVAEVSAIMTAHGPEPIAWGTFDKKASGMLQEMKTMEQIVIEAAITGDYGTAQQAFIQNPLIPSGKITSQLLNELLYAHKDYLPQFSSTIQKIIDTQPELVAYVDKLVSENL